LQRNGEEALLTRLRTLLEKSEAARHQSEYTLLLEQKKFRELKDDLVERDEGTCIEISRYKGRDYSLENRKEKGVLRL